MTAIIRHNFLEILLDIFNTNYPGYDCTINFVSGLHDAGEGWGATEYEPECEIFIDGDLSLAHSIEVIAHELAHVVAGSRVKHEQGWEDVFDILNVKFNEEMERRLSC